MAIYKDIFIRQVVACIVMLLPLNTITAQNCPANIDFENGTFSNWTCLTGNVTVIGPRNAIILSPSNGPILNRHTIISKATATGVKDFYGGFPVLCPNGSNYSVKLGNTNGDHEAEGISYEFTIPANRNTYSLVYYYAVVFANPDHLIYQQPRLEIEVKNITDNHSINCSSFTFIPFGSPLPGFFISPADDSTWCKDWTPVTINLNGNAGKTIRITFKTADCTFNGHFGYAYIDVNTDCGDGYTGGSFCNDDTAVNVAGPYGFAGYNWYNQNFTTLLGTQRLLTLQPPPPSGTVLVLELLPFNGYGCVDTMYIPLTDTLRVKANAGPDALICGKNTSVLLGENPKPGVIYSWLPAAGLSNPNIANPFIRPSINPPSVTSYVLSIRNSGGGCKSTDTVVVKKSLLDTMLNLVGKNTLCSTSRDSAVLYVNPANSIEWLKNGNLINGENKVRYQVLQSGSYYAHLKNSDGCIGNTPTEIITIETSPHGISYPLLYSLINDPLTLRSRDFGGTVQWAPGLYLNNPFTINPVFISPKETELKYQINITSKGGCTITDYQPIKVIREVKIYVPTAFTPNNDGLNDYLYPIAFGATISAFKIYNRMGQEVFSIEKKEKGWDGIFKGLPQEPGVYIWYLSATGIDKKSFSQKGTVTLIR